MYWEILHEATRYMHNITCLAWELCVCWGRSLSWASSCLCSPTAAFSCLLSNCSPSHLPSVLSTCFFCVNCTLAVIQAHGHQTSSTWNSPSFSHWPMLLQMWQGLLIIRIIGGISRGTYSTWNGDEKQSHFYGRRADEEEEEEWCCLCSWQTWLAIAWFSKTDRLIINGDLARQTYIATSCQRMRKPLSFTQCGQAAAARLTISSMLHIYPHAPGGGGLSVRNFATTTIESWTGTNLLFKFCNNIIRNYFVALKKCDDLREEQQHNVQECRTLRSQQMWRELACHWKEDDRYQPPPRGGSTSNLYEIART